MASSLKKLTRIDLRLTDEEADRVATALSPILGGFGEAYAHHKQSTDPYRTVAYSSGSAQAEIDKG